jgi:hypothetical protein
MSKNKLFYFGFIGGAFIAGLFVGMLFGYNSKFDRQIVCSKFKDQAEHRIKDYYASSEVSNYTPNEIFYSYSRNSCVVVWSGGYTNENGIFIQRAIFDVITNEDIFSNLFFHSNTPDKTQEDYQSQILSKYNAVYEEVKGLGK